MTTDEDFVKDDDNKNYFKKQSTAMSNTTNDNKKSPKTSYQAILKSKKELTLSNVKIYVPNDVSQVEMAYHKKLVNSKN